MAANPAKPAGAGGAAKLYPATVEPRRRKALRPEDIDKLGAAIITLTKELWVVKDRQAVTEEILKRRGIDIAEDIDRFVPDGELEAKLSAGRQALVKRIVQDLIGEYEPLA
ncbi:MAG: hypothetical protein SFV21_17220 [Rhodospirillaceae bacterium]|nr:hypothetical protein [Rhodospirillaceae bacterium]